MNKTWCGSAAAVLVSIASSVVHAEAPTAFEPAFRGFGTGAVVGLGTGYLFARKDGFHDGDWKPLVYGTGVGALAGGALGLGLGISDMASGRTGGGAIVLRDTWYGTGFGAIAGLIGGSLVALGQKEGEPILAGAAIGSIAGAALGVGLGLWDASRARPLGTTTTPPSAFSMTVTAAPTADGRLAWLPACVGRF